MIIETKDLVKEYSGRRVVNRVSITVEQGSVVGLLGPNGAGKTTTFYMIVGIERPDEGVVTLDGDDISSLQCMNGPGLASVNCRRKHRFFEK